MKIDGNDIEINFETDDEDMEDGETGFDDGSAQERNTQANRLLTNTRSTRPHIDHTDHGASSA